MKNLNPTSGLRLITSGYMCLPRRIILQLVRNNEIKPIDLGFFIIFLISTDWDKNLHRFGYIRHEMIHLSKIWNIPYSTLEQHLTTLIKKGFIVIDRETPKIPGFHRFTPNRTQERMNTKLSDDDLKNIFPNILHDYVIPEQSQSATTHSFSSSFKSELNVRNEKGGFTDEFMDEVSDSICKSK